MGDYKSPTDDTIRNCYSTGTVSSRSLYSSGIAGVSENPISSCYFAGSGYKYGICFDDEGTDCYFDQEAYGCKTASNMHIGSPLTTAEMKGVNALKQMPELMDAFVASDIGYPQLAYFANHPLTYVRQQSAISVFQPLTMTVRAPGSFTIDPNTQPGPVSVELTLDNLQEESLAVYVDNIELLPGTMQLASPDAFEWETLSQQTSESQLALALQIEDDTNWQAVVPGVIPLLPGKRVSLGTIRGGTQSVVDLIVYHGNAVPHTIDFTLQLCFSFSAL